MEGIKTYNHSQWFASKRIAREKLNPTFVKVVKISWLIGITLIIATASLTALTNNATSQVEFRNANHFVRVK